MITNEEFNDMVTRYNVPADTVEKDYVISWILTCLSNCAIMDDFVFYGGTAIKRIYFEEHRFSEDIDLISEKKLSLEDILQELNILKYAERESNLKLDVDLNRIKEGKDRIQLYINYNGFDQIVGAEKSVQLDFCLRRNFFGDVLHKTVIESYSDLQSQNIKIPVMSLNTILGNKLGLLTDMTRKEPRDIFDIWFLLQRTDHFDFSFVKVCEAYKQKYSYMPTLAVLEQYLNSETHKSNWHSRLENQITDLPKIEFVIKEIKERLRALFEIEDL